jgi:hypothetical protein
VRHFVGHTPGHVRERPVDIGGTSRLNELKPHPQRPCRDFCLLQQVLLGAFAEATWVPEDRDVTDERSESSDKTVSHIPLVSEI